MVYLRLLHLGGGFNSPPHKYAGRGLWDNRLKKSILKRIFIRGKVPQRKAAKIPEDYKSETRSVVFSSFVYKSPRVPLPYF